MPAATLIINDQTQQVAVVEKDNHVRFQIVKLGRDLGRDVEILEGITTEDTLVVSPSDQLVAGELVKTLAWQPAVSDTSNASKKTVGENKSDKKTGNQSTGEKKKDGHKKDDQKISEEKVGEEKIDNQGKDKEKKASSDDKKITGNEK